VDKLVRTINGMKRTYFVYKQVEADNEGLDYEHWKEASPGQYALTDDGYVGSCISRKDYTDKQGRSKTFVKLCCGVGWANNKAKILYEPNKEFGLYSQVKPDYWIRREIRTTRFKNAVTAYIEQLLSSKAIDWTVIGNIYRPEQRIPEATVRRLFKQQEVKEVIEEKLKKVLQEKGITQDMVLDLHLEAINVARDKKDPSNMLRATENLMDLLEMKPGKKVITESVEFGLSSNITEQIESEEKKLKLSQKTEEPIKNESTDSREE
tara:strand:- start:8192 stop:8986 length:795 start_codon:yes stop_codon:yes gene_type:complete